MKTSLKEAQFEANLQVITIACEHLSVDENTSPEDRLGEHNLTPAWELAANSNCVIYLKKLFKARHQWENLRFGAYSMYYTP